MTLHSENKYVESVPPLVLSVEDDDAAFHLLELAFREVEFKIQLIRKIDGLDAFDFLHKRGRYFSAPRPDLVLLNLNLPKMNGMELLSAMQADEDLASIPVVVFTSSNLDSEKAKCLALGAKRYITKPMLFDDYVHAVKSVCAGMPS